jgi:hypothetical protein
MTEAALQTPNDPEVLQTFASVRISQSRAEDARELLQKSMDLWFTEDLEVADPSWPIYSSRLSLSRLLIEVGLFDLALKALETCQIEDDADPENWYLFGWCYYQMMQSGLTEFSGDAKECFEHVVLV